MRPLASRRGRSRACIRVTGRDPNLTEQTHCKSILIVEDDDDIRNALQELLETEGFGVWTAGDGQEALDKLRELPTPCLILLDLMMPVMNGHEFLEVKSSQVKLAPIPVVVVSAVADRTKVPTDHVKEFVKKPIDLDLLLRVVQQYCRP